MVRDNLDTTISIRSIEFAYSVRREKESDILIITVKSGSPVFCRKLADQLAQSYEQYDLLFRQANFLEKEKWIEAQIARHKARLEALELEIKKFKEEHPTFSERQSAREVVEVENQLKNLELQMEEQEHRLFLVRNALKGADSVVVAEVTRDRPLQKQLLALEVELAKLRVEHGEKSRKVHNVLQEMENIRALIDQDLENKSYTTILQSNPRFHDLQAMQDDIKAERSVSMARKKELEQILESAYRKTAAQPELQLIRSRMLRDKQASEKIYTMLNEKIEETRLKKSGVSREIHQIGRASTAKMVQKGKISLGMSLLIGLFVGIALCFVVEKLDRSIRFPSEIEKRFGIPVLGIIPGFELETGRLDLNSDSKILESYRNLRTNLNYSALGSLDTCKSIIVTSALQGEGKSTKAVNLAICFSLDGRKVLLVDADLRRPSVHNLLGRKRHPGLSELLTGQADYSEIFQETKFHGLHIVPAGNKMPNPAEILGNPGLNTFISEAKKTYELIIFDSPAIFPVSDALVLAPKMDGAVVVFRSNYTPIKVGEEVLRKLNQVGASVVGGVLNDVHAAKGKYYYSYYGYYGYSNYYEEGSSGDKHPGPISLKARTWDKLQDIGKGMRGILTWGKTHTSFQKLINWSIIGISIIILALIAFIWIFKIQEAPDYISLDSPPAKGVIAEKPEEKRQPFLNKNRTDSLLILDQIKNWANGLGQLNLPLYMSTYSVVQFTFRDGGYENWKNKAEIEFGSINDINLKIQDIKIKIKGRKAVSYFLQTKTINRKTSQNIKVQYWVKESIEGNEAWFIYREGIKKVDQEVGALPNVSKD
jgi:capsular exopolysaccharide synthesis family protein